MRKKLTVNTLALGNLKQRRKQYAIMIVGIILAMIFSSSTLLFMFSSAETFTEQEHKKYGYQFAIMYTYENDEQFYKNALADGMIADYGLAHIVGFGYTEDEGENLGTPIGWLDEKAKALSNHFLIDGAYPVLENEIAIEQMALMKLGLNAKVGDEITLQVKTQNGLDFYGETEKTYVLSGILADKKINLLMTRGGSGFSADIIPAAIVADGTQTEIGGMEMLSAYVTLEDADYWTISDFWRYVADNSDGYLSNNESYGTTLSALYGIIDSGGYVVVLAGVLILASCVAIINSFNTNLKERRRQIGMLRAVGATKRQIVKVFGREALIISLISAPVSIAISYGLVKLMITAINDEAVMTKSILVLPICAVVCVGVTMFAAMIPLISASAITPMQAIRNIDISRKMKLKKIKTQKQFDVPSHLAKRSAALYKGGKIAVSIMLTVMILFSCVGFSLIHTEMNAIEYDYKYDYLIEHMDDYIYMSQHHFIGGGMSEADKREIESYPYFSSMRSQKMVSTILEIEDFSDYFKIVLPHNYWDGAPLNKENFREKIVDSVFPDYLEYKDIYGKENDFASVDIYSYEENALKPLDPLVIDGRIDYEKLSTGEEVILIVPQHVKWAAEIQEDGFGYSSHIYYDDEKIRDGYFVACEAECPYRAGDKIKLNTVSDNGDKGLYSELVPESFTSNEREITVGAIVSYNEYNESNAGLYIHGDFAIVTTHAGMNFFDDSAKYLRIEMEVDDSISIDDNIDETITAFLQPYADKYSGWFNSSYLYNKNALKDIYALLTSLIAIVTIGFVICGSIVNNSLTATIRERKKEIGTLRAVGADIGVLVKSYIRQLISMFAYGYGIGFALSGIAAIGLAIYNAYEKRQYGYDAVHFIFSPWETVAFCAILFALCSINLWSKIRKEMKNSIVDNIKEL